ncbi:MAG: GNAT family N-acetyltransferase [Anaerolineales bacterium]|nr:GNAT family N-acetyltransferase [Anaerolineales bacterium]
MVEALHIHVRLAKGSDLEAMEWEGEYRRYRRVYQRAMADMRRGRRIILVAEVGEELVGQIFIQLHIHRREFRRGVSSAYIHAFRVRPAYRNRGVGTRLILEAEQVLRDHGLKRAVIAAAHANPDARRLYERLGFRKFMSDPGHWSYVDHLGRLQNVHEPSDILEKWLTD